MLEEARWARVFQYGREDSGTHRPPQADPPLRIIVDDAFLDAKH